MTIDMGVTGSQANNSDKNDGIQLDVEEVEQTVSGKVLEVSKVDSSEEWKTTDCIEAVLQKLGNIATEFGNSITAVSSFLSGVKSISNVEPPAVPSVDDDGEVQAAVTPVSFYGDFSKVAASSVSALASSFSAMNSLDLTGALDTGNTKQSMSSAIYVNSNNEKKSFDREETSKSLTSIIEKSYQDDSSSKDSVNTKDDNDVEVLEEVADSFKAEESVAELLKKNGYHVDDGAKYKILEQGSSFYLVEKTNPDGTIQEILYNQDNPDGLILKGSGSINDSGISTAETVDAGNGTTDNQTSQQTDSEQTALAGESNTETVEINEVHEANVASDTNVASDVNVSSDASIVGDTNVDNVVNEVNDDVVVSDIVDIKEQEAIQNNEILSGLSFSDGAMISDQGDDNQFNFWQ